MACFFFVCFGPFVALRLLPLGLCRAVGSEIAFPWAPFFFRYQPPLGLPGKLSMFTPHRSFIKGAYGASSMKFFFSFFFFFYFLLARFQSKSFFFYPLLISKTDAPSTTSYFVFGAPTPPPFSSLKDSCTCPLGIVAFFPPFFPSFPHLVPALSNKVPHKYKPKTGHWSPFFPPSGGVCSLGSPVAPSPSPST